MLEIVLATLTACLGVVILSAGTMGFLLRPTNWAERVTLIVAALLLIKPGLYTDLIGLGLFAGVLLVQQRRTVPELA